MTQPKFSLSAFAPVRLAYVAALRGVVPQDFGAPFTYVMAGDFDVQAFLCLAASNPEGRFVGWLETDAATIDATRLAARQMTDNATFVCAAKNLPDQIDFFCCIDSDAEDAAAQAERVIEAERRLISGGFFVCRYRPVATAKDSLDFLVDSHLPDLSPEAARLFLKDMPSLGALYFERHPQDAARLQKALAANDPTLLRRASGETETRSATFSLMAELLPRGFAFAGDASIPANYLELTAPQAAWDALLKQQNHLLYESIKDFVTQAETRSDVWVKLPATQTTDPVARFNPFTFGLAMPQSAALKTAVPGDLKTPLFTRLLDLMALLPFGLGDFLAHPAGQGFSPDDVLSAVQHLVACGIAAPMKGRYTARNAKGPLAPVWSNTFNASLGESPIDKPDVQFASTIVGGGIVLPLREALVLQALGRVGLENIAGSLQPELSRLAEQNPALAAQITEATEPTDEIVHTIVTDVLAKNMPRWIAYGLLAA